MGFVPPGAGLALSGGLTPSGFAAATFTETGIGLPGASRRPATAVSGSSAAVRM